MSSRDFFVSNPRSFKNKIILLCNLYCTYSIHQSSSLSKYVHSSNTSLYIIQYQHEGKLSVSYHSNLYHHKFTIHFEYYLTLYEK